MSLCKLSKEFPNILTLIQSQQFGAVSFLAEFKEALTN